MQSGESLGHEGPLRAGVDLLDHRVLLVGSEIRGPEDHAVDVGLAVASLGHEPLGGLPARRQQGSPIGSLELADQASVVSLPQLGHRRQVHPRIGVDQEPAIGRILDLVRAVALGEHDQAGAVEVDAAKWT